MSVTIVLAVEYDIYRQGLRLLLEGQEDFRVIAEATEGLEALQLVGALQPNVLVVDFMLSDLSGLEVTRQVRLQTPATHVVMLSLYSDEAHVLEALRSGVVAYVLTGSSTTDFFQAVREANAGRRYLSPPLTENPIDDHLSRAPGALSDPYESLTAREREVLHLAARGLTNPEIASTLFISPRTVETHRANPMRKLNLRTQADLIRFALQRGLLPIDPKCPKLLPLSTLQSTRWGQRKTRLHLGSVAGRRFDGDLTSDD
jgi:two-component system response regulator NreC